MVALACREVMETNIDYVMRILIRDVDPSNHVVRYTGVLYWVIYLCTKMEAYPGTVSCHPLALTLAGKLAVPL